MTIERVASHSRAPHKGRERKRRERKGRGEILVDMINLPYLLGFVYEAFGYCLYCRICDDFSKREMKAHYKIHYFQLHYLTLRLLYLTHFTLRTHNLSVLR